MLFGFYFDDLFFFIYEEDIIFLWVEFDIKMVLGVVIIISVLE